MADINEIFSKEAIQQLDLVEKGLLANLEAAQKLNTEFTNIGKATSSYKEKTNQLNDAQIEQNRIAKENEKVLLKLDAALKGQTDELEKNKLKLRETQKEQRDKIRAESDAEKQSKNSINALKQQTKELQRQRDVLDINSKEYRQLTQQIAANNAKLKQLDADVNVHNRNVGNYSSALKGLGTKLIGLGAAFGATIGAVELFKGIMNSTQTIGDKFAAFLEGAKQSAEFLGRAIANLDFKNLISGLRAAYEEGRRYALILDEIEDRKRSQRIQVLDIEGEIIDLKTTARNRQLDLKTREEAIDKIVELEKKKLVITQQINDEVLANELENAAQISGLREEEITDFVKNYRQYEDRLIEGAELQKELNDLMLEAGKTGTTSPEGVVIIQQGADAYQRYTDKLAGLNDEQRKSIDFYNKSQQLGDEQRERIEQAITAQIQANNELKASDYELVTFRNRLYTELIREQNKQNEGSTDKIIYENDLRKLDSIEVERVITDDYINNLKLRENAHIDFIAREDERLREKYQNERQLAEGITNALAEFGQVTYDFSSALMQSEMQQLDQRYQYELQLAGDNAAKKEKADKKYQDERKKLLQKQAKIDKAFAIFQATINFAQALVAALTVPPPASFVFEAITAALAGIALAAVIATPLPTYAKGTKSAKRGPAVWGEKGRELMIGPDGRLALSPSTASLVNLKGGERILTNRETELLMRTAKGADDIYSRKMMEQMHDDNREIVKAIRQQKPVKLYKQAGRVTDRPGNYYGNYYQKKIAQ